MSMLAIIASTGGVLARRVAAASGGGGGESDPPPSTTNVRLVKPSATGSGSGLVGDGWANAMAFPATPARDTTYYLADGSYGGKTFSTANNGTQLIVIRHATVDHHATDTGWSDTLGDGQAVFSNCQVTTDYWHFNGIKRNANWRNGGVDQYGLSFGNLRIDNGSGSAGADNCTWRFCDIHGGGRDTGAGDDVIYTLYGCQNITFSRCALRDSDRTIFLTRGTPTNWLIEHCFIARNASSPAIHGEIHSSTSSSNWTWRWNVIEDPEGTAVWAFINNGTATDWHIYGNVIYHTAAYKSAGREGLSGVLFCANDASNDNTLNGLRFYNNTIWNIAGLWSGVVIQSGSNNLVYNNIWSQCVTPNNSGGTYNYNTYYSTTTQFDSGGQSGTVGTQPLVSPSTGNFALVGATAAGLDVGSPYNVDANGVTRGSSGVWDRGAFEYV